MLISAIVKKGWPRITMWREISRQRRQLLRDSETLAKDMGISRAEAEWEAKRPFWDASVSAAEVQQHKERSKVPLPPDGRNCCVHP